MYDDSDDIQCPGCSTFLSVPYIQCYECGPPSVHICLQCFARGVEFGMHYSNHKYQVLVSGTRVVPGSVFLIDT